MIIKLDMILFGVQTSNSVVLAFLGYFSDIFVFIGFKESFWKKITLIFTLSILNRFFTFWGYILHVPLGTFFGEKWNVQASITVVIGIMYALIALGCWLALKDKSQKLIQIELRRDNWVVLGSIAVFARLIIDFCSDYVFSLNPYSDSKIIWAMIALSAFVLAVLVLYLYSTLTTIKHLELKSSTDRLVFERETQQRYYETQLHNQEELRRMKHDMNGHLTTISRLLSEDNCDNALGYLTKLSNYVASNQKALYCEDPYLNAVVTNYAEIFIRNDTLFEQEIQIGIMDAHHVEICLILNNALQNALEASLKLPPEQRYVKLQVKSKQSQLLIRFTNRFIKELNISDGLPRSTKVGDGHGYGLTSIRNAAESLGGFADYKIEDDIFVLDVAM
ncbi:MAG: ATP-binding protein [Clostridiaceae bacterium]